MDSNVMAQQLVLRLESLLDVLDARDRGKADKGDSRGRRSRVSGPACQHSDLDWIGAEGDVITVRTSKAGYDRQIALCQSCEVVDKCLQIAISENRDFGIWGGLMPAERRRYVRLMRKTF